MIWRYEFDTLWVWGYEFNMVLLCLYGLGCGLDMVLDIWFWYGFDMVWERSAFFRVPHGLASRKETETAPGQAFARFLEGFCGFNMILIRFWYGFDAILIWFWYNLIWCLMWFWYGSGGLASKKETFKNQGHAFGQFLDGFCGFDMILILFWYDREGEVVFSQVEPQPLRNSHFPT